MEGVVIRKLKGMVVLATTLASFQAAPTLAEGVRKSNPPAKASEVFLDSKTNEGYIAVPVSDTGTRLYPIRNQRTEPVARTETAAQLPPSGVQASKGQVVENDQANRIYGIGAIGLAALAILVAVWAYALKRKRQQSIETDAEELLIRQRSARNHIGIEPRRMVTTMRKDDVGISGGAKSAPKIDEAQFKKDRAYYEAKLGEFKAKYEAAKTRDEIFQIMGEDNALVEEISGKYPEDRLWYALRYMIWSTRDWRNEAMTRVTGDKTWAESRY